MQETKARVSSVWLPSEKGRWTLRERILPSTTGSDKQKETLYILGLDATARLLASELKPVFDSVRLFRPNGPATMTEVEYRARHSASDDDHQDQPHPVDTPIRNIVVSGSPVDAVMRMIQLRDRIDSRTAICLMNDGLGVAETLDETVFHTGEKPNYLLGQFSSKRHRNVSNAMVSDFGDRAPKQANIISHLGSRLPFKTFLLALDPSTGLPPRADSPAAMEFMARFQQSRVLNGHNSRFDRWIELKLKNMILNTVVDPICAVLDCRYDEILRNSKARALMYRLIDEVQMVANSLPELYRASLIPSDDQGGTDVTSFSPIFKGTQDPAWLQRACLHGARRMKTQESRLTRQIRQRRPLDLQYFNGWFIKRGKKLGLPTYYNEMMVDMVIAKYRIGWSFSNVDAIPFETTSAAASTL